MYVDIPMLQLYAALYELPQYLSFATRRDAEWYSDRRYSELYCPFCGGSVSAEWKNGFPRFTSHNPAACSHFRSTSPIDFYAMLSGISFAKAKDNLYARMMSSGVMHDGRLKQIADSMPSEKAIAKENAARIEEILTTKDEKKTELALAAKGIAYGELPEGIQRNVAYAQDFALFTSSGHERVDTGLMTVARTARHGISARIRRIRNTKTMEYFTYGLQTFQFGRSLPFGLDFAFDKPAIAITEGDIDALAMMCAGIPAVSISGIQNVSRIPVFLKGMAVCSIIDALDNDAAGSLGSTGLEALCHDMGPSYKRLSIPKRFNDPSAFWQEEKDLMQISVANLLSDAEASDEMIDYITGPSRPETEDFIGDYIDVYR